eukprot:11154963-Lingulodinium_polyedra.AAC.1
MSARPEIVGCGAGARVASGSLNDLRSERTEDDGKRSPQRANGGRWTDCGRKCIGGVWLRG